MLHLPNRAGLGFHLRMPAVLQPPPPSQPPPQSTSIARNPGIDTLNTVSTRKAVSAVASTRSLIVGFRAITAPNNSNSS